MRIKVYLVILIIVSVWQSTAFGLGMGGIEVDSHLNEQLEARISIVTSDPAELEALEVRLASPEDFSRVGLQRSQGLNKLTFKVVDDPTGYHISVSSTEAIKEPFLNFLIEVNWANGRLLREYTVLLDPPVYVPTSTTSVTPSTTTTSGLDDYDTSPEVTDTRDDYQSTVDDSYLDSDTRSDTDDDDSNESQTDQSDYSSSYGGEEYGPVPKGDSLWEIALQTRPDSSINVNQMMLALLRSNPDAFFQDNINALKSGEILRIPDRDEILDLTSQDALDFVKSHNSLWNEYRVAVSGTAPIVSTAGTDPGRWDSYDTDTSDDTDDSRLELVPSNNNSDSDYYSSGSSNDDFAESADADRLRDDVSRAQEELSARESENSDLRSRVGELESLVDNLQRAVEIKDSDLAVLQAQLADSNDSSFADTDYTSPTDDLYATDTSSDDLYSSTDTSTDDLYGDSSTDDLYGNDGTTTDDLYASEDTPTDDLFTTDDTATDDLYADDTTSSSDPLLFGDPDTSSMDPEDTGISDPFAVDQIADTSDAEVAAEDTTEPVAFLPNPEPSMMDQVMGYATNPIAIGGLVGLFLLIGVGVWLSKRGSKESVDSGSSMAERMLAGDMSSSSEPPIDEFDQLDEATSSLDDSAVEFDEDLGSIEESSSTPEDDDFSLDFGLDDEESDLDGDSETTLEHPTIQRPLTTHEKTTAERPLADDEMDFDMPELDDEFDDDGDISFDIDDSEEVSSLDAALPKEAEADDFLSDGLDLDFAETDLDEDVNLDFGDLDGPDTSLESIVTDDDLGEDSMAQQEEINFDHSPPPIPDLADDLEEDVELDLGDEDLFAGEDAIATKLDLARAYLDMGDPDGAKSMLNEILSEGSDMQKQDAQKLLDQVS